MLFLQGSRDALADLALLQGTVGGLEGRATLELIEDADHAFHVPAKSGRKDADVLALVIGFRGRRLDGGALNVSDIGVSDLAPSLR